MTTPDVPEAAETEATDTPARPRPPRWAVTTVGTLLVILVAMSTTGDLLTTTLSDTHPAWLIALNSRNRILALTTNQLDPWSYYGIAGTRLLVSDPLFFLLGYWYGDAAIVWMEKRTQTWGQLLRRLETWFAKAAYPLVFIAPNNPICLFAGAAGMPIRAFVALNVSGTITRLYIIRYFGEQFEDPIANILDFFREYRLALFGASAVLLLISILLESKKQGETEIATYAHLEEELEAAERGEDEPKA